jgi:hypothetical protein
VDHYRISGARRISTLIKLIQIDHLGHQNTHRQNMRIPVAFTFDETPAVDVDDIGVSPLAQDVKSTDVLRRRYVVEFCEIQISSAFVGR